MPPEKLRFGKFAALIFVLGVSANAFDKLDDFQQAARQRGCEAIPYASERETCRQRSQEKDKRCKEFSCERSKVEKILEDYKETAENLEKAKERNDQQSVESLTRKLADLDNDLTTRKSEAEDRMHEGYDCLEAREKVQRGFSDAKEMVEKETDEALQPYIRTLVDEFENGRQSHVQPMQNTTTAIEGCKWVSEITWK